MAQALAEVGRTLSHLSAASGLAKGISGSRDHKVKGLCSDC